MHRQYGRLPSAVTRGQTNGILCLIDDDDEEEEEEEEELDRWLGSVINSHVSDRHVTMQHLCDFHGRRCVAVLRSAHSTP